MAATRPFTLDQLWRHPTNPAPRRKYVARTEGGACRAAALLARYLLVTGEAEEVERQLAARRRTVGGKGGHLSLQQETTFVASQLATAVLLCIVGTGHVVRSCATVDYRGRREVDVEEATYLYRCGIIVVSVDAEGSEAISIRSRSNAFEKLRLHRSGSILELLERSRRALETDVR